MPEQKPVPQQATVPELINQARVLSAQGTAQDALMIYNHAYLLAQRPDAGH